MKLYETIQKAMVDEKELLNEKQHKSIIGRMGRGREFRQFRKILRKQAIVEELHDEENTKTGEFDDKSKGVYSVGKNRGSIVEKQITMEQE